MRLGILFDIEALGGGLYGHAAYRLLFDILGTDGLAGCQLSDGDTAACLAGRSNEYCIAIESPDRRQLHEIRMALATCGRPGLLVPALRFLDDAEVDRQPLVRAARVDESGALVDCTTSWVLSALSAAKEARAGGPDPVRPKGAVPSPGLPRSTAGAEPSATSTRDPVATVTQATPAGPEPAVAPSRTVRSPGELLGQRYRVLSVHRGGMGLVYVVEDLGALRRGLSLTLALKTFHERYLWDGAIQRRFEREALQWVQLGSHPHIVHALLVEQIESRPYIWLEFVDGGSLADRLEHGPLGVTEALEIALQFVRGMRHAYEKHGVIHRDIKPANTLVTRDGVVKISDFGLSKLRAELLGSTLPEGEPGSLRPSPELQAALASASGVLVGTPAYMPPEAILDPTSVDTRGDVYSFGVMFHEMLSGCRLFRGPDLLNQHLHAQPVPPSVVNPAVPRLLDEIAIRCVEKAPERRFASFADLEDALLGCGASLDGFQPRGLPDPVVIPARGVSFMKGITLMGFGRYEPAIAAFEEVLALEPNEAEAINNIGVCLGNMGRFDEAASRCARAVALRPEYAEAWANLGGFLGRVGRYEEGLTSCERAVTLKPTWAEAHANRGANLAGLGRFDEACDCFERALRVDPAYWRAHLMAAEALAYSGARPVEILERVERALEIEPRDATGHALAAACWDDLGNEEKAKEHLRIAEELDPANVLAERVRKARAGPRSRG